MAWWLLLSAAAAAPQAGPAAICADIAKRLDDPHLQTEDVVQAVRNDDRSYTADVLTCLCVTIDEPEVEAEARRHFLRDTVPLDAARWTIAQDPHATEEFQVAALLARRLEAAGGRGKAFAVLPTRTTPMRWLSVHKVFDRFRTFEIPGTAFPTRAFLDDRGIELLPEGPLETLAPTLKDFDLVGLAPPVYDRALWLDIAPADEDAGAAPDAVPQVPSYRVTWLLEDLTTVVPPYRRVQHDSVVIEHVPNPFVENCDAPTRVMRTTWNTRVAWPASRTAVTVSGGLLATVFGALTLDRYVAYQRTDDPTANKFNVSANVAYGTVSLAGLTTAILGATIPGKAWRP